MALGNTHLGSRVVPQHFRLVPAVTLEAVP